jgi:YVTN family beta-propeller protein
VLDTKLARSTKIRVGARPFDLGLSADGLSLYVLNSDDASVSIVDTHTNSLKRTIKLPGAQQSAYISILTRRNHSFAYVSNVYATPPVFQRLPTGSVSVLDLSSDRVVATVTNSPQSISLGCAEGSAASPDGRWLFVNTQCRSYADFAEDPILVIDTDTNTVTDVINMTALDLPNVGNAIAVRPDGRQIWAGGGNACTALHPTYKHHKCGEPGGDPITVIDTVSRKPIREFYYGAPGYISLSPDSRFAYLATDKSLLEINTNSFTVARKLAIPGSSGSVAFSKDGAYGYTSVSGRDVVVRFERK